MKRQQRLTHGQTHREL